MYADGIRMNKRTLDRVREEGGKGEVVGKDWKRRKRGRNKARPFVLCYPLLKSIYQRDTFARRLQLFVNVTFLFASCFLPPFCVINMYISLIDQTFVPRRCYKFQPQCNYTVYHCSTFHIIAKHNWIIINVKRENIIRSWKQFCIIYL